MKDNFCDSCGDVIEWGWNDTDIPELCRFCKEEGENG